jgi:hypothetical protein
MDQSVSSSPALHPARYTNEGDIPDVEISNCCDTDSQTIVIRGATARVLRQQAARLTPDERLAAFVMSLSVKGGNL